MKSKDHLGWCVFVAPSGRYKDKEGDRWIQLKRKHFELEFINRRIYMQRKSAEDAVKQMKKHFPLWEYKICQIFIREPAKAEQ